MASPNSKTPLPELDHKGFARNQKTGWLLYLDRLTAWLWQDNDGAARWTLIPKRSPGSHSLKAYVSSSSNLSRGLRLSVTPVALDSEDMLSVLDAMLPCRG